MDYELIKAEALEKGYTEIQADAIIATLKAREKSGKVSDYLLDYPALKAGNYSVQRGGIFSVNASNIEQMSKVINMLHATGQPLQVIDGHRSEVSLGAMPAARVGAMGKMRAAIISDPNTIAGIRERALGMSVEAKRNFSSNEYTGGEVFSYFPTAWAVLPVGSLPAVSPGEALAAANKDDNKPVRLFAQETPHDGENTPRKGDRMEDKERIEALEAENATVAEKLSTLEAANADLTTQIEAVTQERDALKSAKEQEEIEAAEKAVEVDAKAMVAKKLPGVREEALSEIMACEGNDAKSAMIKTLDKLLPGMTPAEQKLEAGESKVNKIDGKTDKVGESIEAAESLAKEKDIKFTEALEELRKRGE